MYDCIIIGAGPAGMTAAIYTARKKIKTLLLTKEVGGQMVWSSDIENYSGFTMVTGAELTAKFQKHMESLTEDLEVKVGAEVVTLEKNITSFVVEDKQGNTYFGKSIIIASGKMPKHLGIAGEKEFLGHGVSTCATCDAPLYKNKNVAVIGGGNSALDAIMALSKVCKKVVVVNMNKDLHGEEIICEKIRNLTNVQIRNNTKALAIIGEKAVTGLQVQEFGKDQEQIAVDGVFVEIGYEPSILFDDLTDKNNEGEIKTNADLATNVAGVFAAGDVNDAWGEQIVIAAGEGAKAALAVSDYLNKMK